MTRPYLLLLLIVTSSSFNKSFGQKGETFIMQGDTINLAKDTVIRNELIRLNLQEFKGKTVKELLKNNTIKQYKRYWFSQEPPLKLGSLNLTYARGLDLVIYFDTLKYQPKFSKTGQFSFAKILKEKISDLQLDQDFFEENVVKKYSKHK